MTLEILKIIILACQINSAPRSYGSVKVQNDCQKNIILCIQREKKSTASTEAYFLGLCLVKRK